MFQSSSPRGLPWDWKPIVRSVTGYTGFNPLHHEGCLGTKTASTGTRHVVGFNPLHHEGCLGTATAIPPNEGCLGTQPRPHIRTIQRSFNPLHHEGCLGTLLCVAVMAVVFWFQSSSPRGLPWDPPTVTPTIAVPPSFNPLHHEGCLGTVSRCWRMTSLGVMFQSSSPRGLPWD